MSQNHEARASHETVSWMDDFQRDPTRYFRERFAAITAASDREVEQAAKDARERELREGYARRHTPPDAA